MKQDISKVLTMLDIQPILVDVGASGAPPKIWDPVAPYSIYVGFDPDRRELHETSEGQFARSIIVNEAVTSATNSGEVHFYLTSSPFCSSTLSPDTESLEDYLFSNLFVVEREVAVPASTLDSVFERMGIKNIDWFKTDSQGTDLRLFQSLPDDLRSRVLAVDIEPGLIDAYQGEDLFVDAHRKLLHQGFWCSALAVKGSVRMRRTTLQRMASKRTGLTDNDIYGAVRQSPGWCEATYLRTIESLDQRDADERDYALLWIFAMMQQQWGFALDVAVAYEQRFALDAVSFLLCDLPLKLIAEKNRNAPAMLKRFLPSQLKQFLKQLTLRSHS